jgi:hypothetical protein
MGRKNEETGQAGAISCIRAREHFYDFADCELSSKDRCNLSHHEESCPVCGPEFKEWRRLQGVLQNSGKNAATDFKAGVVARIRETRQEPATRHSVVWDVIRQHGWARGLAAAAVVLIMLTGAAKLPAVEGMLAQLTRQPIVAFNPNPAPSLTQPATPAIGQQPGTTSPGSATSPTRTNTPATSPSSNGVTKTQSVQPQQPTTPATGRVPGNSGFAVSNKSMVISTTTLKVAVGDLAQARSDALDIANNCGAGLTSEQSAQDGNSNLLFLHFTVDSGTASAFLDNLSSLGSVVSKDTSNNDVTGDYNRTLDAYNTLLAQQAAADDNDQDQYTSQINFLKNELQNWSDASGKQVVMLWLIQS